MCIFFLSQYHPIIRRHDQLCRPLWTRGDTFFNRKSQSLQYVFARLLESEGAFGFKEIGNRESLDPEEKAGSATVYAIETF